MDNMSFTKYSFYFATVLVLYYSFYINHIPQPKISGEFSAVGWERVAETFRKQVESGWQRGGALSIYHKGELVVEVYGGFADEDILEEWTQNTLSQLFSTTKSIASIVMAMLVDRGLLDYSKPVCHYWPEFAQNDKGNITVEMLLGHQAGLAALDEPFDMFDIVNDAEKVARILASQKPLWRPGTGTGYHAITIGLYQDELIKRVDPKHRTVSQFFKEEIAKPYDLDIFIGLPKEENYRCARLTKGRLYTISDYIKSAILKFATIIIMYYQESLMYKVSFNPKHFSEIYTIYNHPDWRAVPCASNMGFGTATSLAKLNGMVAFGKEFKRNKPLLDDEIVKLLQEPLENGNGTEQVYWVHRAYGRGFMTWKSPMETSVFGFIGAGGQVGKCDPSNELGIGYITNHASADLDVDDKYHELERVIYDTLENMK